MHLGTFLLTVVLYMELVGISIKLNKLIILNQMILNPNSFGSFGPFSTLKVLLCFYKACLSFYKAWLCFYKASLYKIKSSNVYLSFLT